MCAGIADLGVALVLTGKSSTEVEMLNNSVTPYFVCQLFQAEIDHLIYLLSSGYKLIGSHSGVKLCRWTKVCFFLSS